jgi:hypothetical protein
MTRFVSFIYTTVIFVNLYIIIGKENKCDNYKLSIEEIRHCIIFQK